MSASTIDRGSNSILISKSPGEINHLQPKPTSLKNRKIKDMTSGMFLQIMICIYNSLQNSNNQHSFFIREIEVFYFPGIILYNNSIGWRKTTLKEY